MPKKKAVPASTKKSPPKRAKRGGPKGVKRGGGKAIGQSELFKRLECVEESMERGRFSHQQLIDDLIKKGFPCVSRATADKYSKRVRERWAEERVKDREMLRDAALRRLRRYYDDMKTKLGAVDPKHADAVSLLREMHRIEGVYQPEQIEMKATLDFEDWTLGELDHFINTGEEPARVSGIPAHGEDEDQEASDD
jgi:hypothetical protein